MQPPLSILLAEDNQAIQATLAAFLAGAGHRVVQASNGEEASTALEREPVDLLVTDVLMPRKDGLELIQEVHGKQPRLPIIAMSGGGHLLGDLYCLNVAKSFGATVTLSKPFSGGEILSAIDEAMAAKHGE